MKRFLLPAVLFSISFAVAGAEERQDIKVSNIMASGCLNDVQNTQKAPAREVALEDYGTIGILYSNNTLSISLNAWEFNCGVTDFKPTVTIENGIIDIITNSGITTPMWCYCPYNISFDLNEIKPGSYIIRMFGSEWSFEGDIRLFSLDLTDGAVIHLTEDETSHSSFFNENTEWVYYNEDGSGNTNIFRLTYTGDNESANPYKGWINMRYDNDPALNETIAEITGYTWDSPRVLPLKETLPTILRHYATPSERFNVWDEGADKSSRFYISFNPFANVGESAFYRDFFTRTMENVTVKSVEAVEIDGSLRLKFTADTGYEWIEGIGAVSPKMPQSIVFPAYAGEFNETEMTRLMYVRDLRDNHIIYGSPAKDPNWSPAGVASIADREECLNVAADRIIFSGEGVVEISVYDIDGKKITSVTGSGDTELSTSALLPGVYIAEAVTGKNVVTRKFYK